MMLKSKKRHNWKSALQHTKLASLFYEPSTRTRQNFETAVRELGGDTIGFSGTIGGKNGTNTNIRGTSHGLRPSRLVAYHQQ